MDYRPEHCNYHSGNRRNLEFHGIYTNISNGIFIFVPDVQAEKELQAGETSCGSENVLPSRIRAELWRTDTPDSAEGTRRTAQTMWINSPGGSELPLVVLEGGSQ